MATEYHECLFNIAGETIMLTVCSKLPEAGYNISINVISKIKYADDITLLEMKESNLQKTS